ncbi:Nn.00g080470.m01.CDS01 [Neocucurbitaria sp. VM-36]
MNFFKTRHQTVVRQALGEVGGLVVSLMMGLDIAGVVLSMKALRLVVADVPVVLNLAFLNVDSLVVLVEALGIMPSIILCVDVMVGNKLRHMVAIVVLRE